MEKNKDDIIEELHSYYGYRLPKWYFNVLELVETYPYNPKSGLHNKMKTFIRAFYHDEKFKHLLTILSKLDTINLINCIYYIRVSTLYSQHLIYEQPYLKRSHNDKKESLIKLRKLTSVYLGFVLALCKVKSINPLSVPSVQFIMLQYRILFKSKRLSHAGHHDANIVDKYWFKREEFGKYMKG